MQKRNDKKKKKKPQTFTEQLSSMVDRAADAGVFGTRRQIVNKTKKKRGGR